MYRYEENSEKGEEGVFRVLRKVAYCAAFCQTCHSFPFLLLPIFCALGGLLVSADIGLHARGARPRALVTAARDKIPQDGRAVKQKGIIFFLNLELFFLSHVKDKKLQINDKQINRLT